MKTGKKRFFGTTTVGKKGQVVVPSEARKVLKIKEGEKLLVFGMGNNMLAFSRLSQAEKFAKMLAERLESIKKAIAKNS